MIQKPITTKIIFKKYKSMKLNKKTWEMKEVYLLNNYFIKNSIKFIKYLSVNNNLYLIKICKQIDNFYTNTLTWVQILSISKYIMNEIICTFEDLDINIDYQDIGNIHI